MHSISETAFLSVKRFITKITFNFINLSYNILLLDMYTKEQLEQMPIPELMEVAGQLGVKVSQDDTMENVIYEILDKAAIESASGASATKRKRTRIAKKDTDKVYSVRGKEGENLDVKNQKNKAPEAPSSRSPSAEAVSRRLSWLPLLPQRLQSRHRRLLQHRKRR